MQPPCATALLHVDSSAQNLLRLVHVQTMEVDHVTWAARVIHAEDVVLGLTMVIVADTVMVLSLNAELLGLCLLPRGIRRARLLVA